MLTTLGLVLAVFGGFFLIMALGHVFGKTKIKGSCGGLAGKSDCSVCGTTTPCSTEDEARTRLAEASGSR